MAKKQNEVKVCLWTHVQDESAIIEKMIKSCAPYIDYWVLVDNGSKDNTKEIIQNFFDKEGIPGILYDSEIGWKGHGINRQHSCDLLTKTDHGCDYILRVDADEGIAVEEDFDWSIIKQKEAWHITMKSANHCISRMWMWKWGLPWFWAKDVAHETIHLKQHFDAGEEQLRSPDVGMMPQGFVHIPIGGGKSYENPIKYIQDVLKLENQIFERLRDGSTLEKEAYHLYYLCQSFNYAGMDSNSEYHCSLFPYGKENAIEFNKRGVFYWTKYMETFGEDWYILKERGYLYKFAGMKQLAVEDWIKSYELNNSRSESLFEAVRTLFEMGEYSEAARLGEKLLHIKCPYPEDTYFVEYNKYHDTGWWVGELVSKSLHKYGMETKNKGPVKMADQIVQQLLKRKDVKGEARETLVDYRGFFNSFLEENLTGG